MREAIGAALQWAREDLPSWVRDGFGVAGLSMIVYGVHQIYAPAGWIVGGAIVVGLVFMSEAGK